MSNQETQTNVQPSVQPSNIDEKLVNSMSAAIGLALAQQQQNLIMQQADLRKKEQQELQLRGVDLSGLAISDFKLRMEKEIADGNFTKFHCYKKTMKEFNGFLEREINGYKLKFVSGKVTKVPNSLMWFVNEIFNTDSDVRDFHNAKTVVRDSKTGAIDTALTDQLQDAMDQTLNRAQGNPL